MTYNNRYNILDKIIAKFRSREITKNFNLEGKKILDFGCGPSLNELKNRYSTCSKVTLVDKLGEPFKDGNTEFLNYNTDDQAEAWNLPNMTASLNADYQITEKWYSGANLFFVGERKDENRSLSLTFVDPIVTLDSYFDANAHVGYRFNDQLSAFVKGSNLLNNNYQKWMDYNVQGVQVLGGVTYKFDWD